jgi:DNA-binding MarR family transcriptional regulator
MDEIGLMGKIFLAQRRFYVDRLLPFGITIQQLNLIRLARRRGPISPSAAAAGMFCDRPTTTVIARNCVSNGWLARRRSASDRRSSRLELTGEGEEILDRIEREKVLSRGVEADPLDVLEPTERSAFQEALKKVERRVAELYG